jgi:hypothetical protein
MMKIKIEAKLEPKSGSTKSIGSAKKEHISSETGYQTSGDQQTTKIESISPKKEIIVDDEYCEREFKDVKFRFLVKFKETVPPSVDKRFLKDVYTKSWVNDLPFNMDDEKVKQLLDTYEESLIHMPKSNEMRSFTSKLPLFTSNFNLS